MLCRHHHHHRASTSDVDDDAVSPIPPLHPHADNDNSTTAPPVPLDAVLGLQALGHTVDIYTSHHDPNHCFDETRDGSRPHRRPLDLAPSPYTTSSRPSRAIGMVNPISFSPSLTCTRTRRLLCRPTLDLLPLLRVLTGMLKALYRYLMDYLEEADTLIANSKFTASTLRRIKRRMSLEDNIRTLNGLVERPQSSKLSFNVITPLIQNSCSLLHRHRDEDEDDDDGMSPLLLLLRSHVDDDDVLPPPPPPPRLHVDDDATTARPLR
ncbi:hypothetical protein EV363DRAFT_1449088 [Boletus edulis]|nr:hypothetical protein EV363DRAFT_1449088 [Boletus edulis]